MATYQVSDLRKALGMKRKTGSIPALQGWSLGGQKIKTLIFKRFNRVEYIGNNGETIGVFDTLASLDD